MWVEGTEGVPRGSRVRIHDAVRAISRLYLCGTFVSGRSTKEYVRRVTDRVPSGDKTV